MRAEDLEATRALALFAGMEEAHFLDLTRAAYLQRFPPHVRLIAEGEPADFLCVVIEGCLELFAEANGRETTIALIRPLSVAILAAVLRDAENLMSARTIERSKVLLIPAAAVRTAIARDIAFSQALVWELAGGYRGMVKALKNQKLRSGVERLANHLIQTDAERGGHGAFRLEMDKRTLASLLGMTPENLSRAFATLRPYGVEVDGAAIRLNNMKDLKTLAKMTPLIDG